MYCNLKSLCLSYLWRNIEALDLIDKWIEKKSNLGGLYNTKAFLLYKIWECEYAIETIEKSFEFVKEDEILYTNARLLYENCIVKENN